jgi:hypothetical protein
VTAGSFPAALSKGTPDRNLQPETFMDMVEVFKTNVSCPEHAGMFLNQIRQTQADYKANFDLDDCDRILRVECASGTVNPSLVINLLKKCGFEGEVLADEIIV